MLKKHIEEKHIADMKYESKCIIDFRVLLCFMITIDNHCLKFPDMAHEITV